MEYESRVRNKPISADKMLVAGFAFIIFLGALLLSLPQSSSTGESVGFLNALFTSTSATCVTGLITVDTGTAFSTLGHVIIITLIQIGGLGFMIFATLILIALGKRISLKNRMLLRDTFNIDSLTGVVKLSLKVVIIALSFELIGAILLSIRFVPMFGLKQGIAFGLFHSISAFCNAGFDLFGNYESLTNFSNDPLVLLTISFLIIFGGLGFLVISDLINNKLKFKKLRLHSKIVIVATVFLLLFGTAIFYITEIDNTPLWAKTNDNFFNRSVNTFFQSTTLRTAGYASLDQAHLTNAGKLISVILMFIGASPTSTGGGVKTSTTFILMLEMWYIIRGYDDVKIFDKTVNTKQLNRSSAIVLIYLLLLLFSSFLISIFERHTGKQLIDIMFEAVSAMATVGVTSVGTASFSVPSQITLIILMYLGRVGPLTLAVALASKQNAKSKIQYPEERILIG